MEYWGDLNSLLIHLIWLIWTLFFSFQCDCDHAWRHQAYPATAEAHLQKAERLKLAWRDNKDKITKALISTGDTVGDMHQLNMLLLPWVICPHGGFGPQLKHFLFHKWPHAYLAFTGIPNTERMYRNINQHRSPSGFSLLPIICGGSNHWVTSLPTHIPHLHLWFTPSDD